MNRLTKATLLGYRSLIRLYPRSFRRQFESDMLQDFADAAGDATNERGLKGAFSHTRRAYYDAVAGLFREWAHETTVVIGALSVCATAALMTAPIVPPLPNIPRPPAHPISFDELSLMLLMLGLLFMIAIVIVLANVIVKPRLERGAHPEPPASRSAKP
jgi:hypothetical protein